MSRGNDPTAAAELADRYGDGAGNAEALIEANAARFSKELVAAQLLGKDDEASKELDYAAVAKAADVDTVLDAAVRRGVGDDPAGGYVVYVYEVDGRMGKGVLLRDGGDLVNPSQGHSSRDVHRAALQADVTARQKAAEAIAEANAQAEKAKADAMADAQKIIEDAQDEARKVREDAVKDAEKARADEAKADKADKPKPAAKAKPTTGGNSGS